MASQCFAGDISHVNAVYQGTNTVNYVGTEYERSRDSDECIRALRQTDPELHRRALLNTTHKGLDVEGAWESLLDDPLFQKWERGEDAEEALVQVCEEECIGRTGFAIFLTKHLERYISKHEDHSLLYFFCASNSDTYNTAASILRGLIWMFCQEPNLVKFLQDRWSKSGSALLEDHRIEDLWQIFEDMVNNSQAKRIYCVVDGIDVCENGKLQHLLHKINRLFGRQTKPLGSKITKSFQRTLSRTLTDPEHEVSAAKKLRMMILSRKLPDPLQKELDSFPRLALHSEKEIGNLIEAKIQRVSTARSAIEDSGDETIGIVSRIITSGRDQGFLFVGLVSDKIEGMTTNQLKRYNQNAPKTLQEFHCQTLRDVPPRQRLVVHAVLKWVALAKRPLSTLELTKAVKYSLKKSFSKKSLKKALSVCHGLLMEDEQRVVLGQGVIELLFEEKSPLLDIEGLREFVSERSDVHSELANACIAYLQGSANLEKSRRVKLSDSDKLKPADEAFVRKHPFLEYAIANWTYHAKLGNLDKTKYDVNFFSDKLPRRRLWWQSYWISFRQSCRWKWTAPGNFSLLHLAAFFDIVPLAQHVEQQGQLNRLLPAEDHQGMKPINWATENSASAMVQFLLERGDFDEKTLLQAARTGQVSIIRMLLENRQNRVRSPQIASQFAAPETPYSPLQSIRKTTLRSLSNYSKPKDEAEQLRLAAMSPANAGYGRTKSETPMHIAAACGHEEAVAAFLDAEEDCNVTTDGGWTPLHNAAWFGRASIVDQLIDAGASVMARTNDQLTPLHCGVKNSKLDVVEGLLSNMMVEVEARDQFGVTPFHMACKAHNPPMMEVLFKSGRGINIEQRMRIGWTPLMWAAIDNAFNVAKWLIEHGAEVNAKWAHLHEETGKTIELSPLDLAKSYHHPGIARLLEEHGATNTKSLINNSASDLPLPEVHEETYDVPKIEDIAVLQLERMETGDSLVSGDGADSGASEIEAESDSDDNDVDDGEHQSRKQSEGSLDEDVETYGQSSFALQGLGISEEVEDESGFQGFIRPSNDSNKEAENDPSDSMIGPDNRGLVEEPQTYGDIGSELDTADGSVKRVDNNLTARPQLSDGRKGSGHKSPPAMSGLFFRAGWKRMGSSPSVERSLSLPTVIDETGRPAESNDAVLEDDVDGSKTSKTGNGALGRFKGKRMFSWKQENGKDRTQVSLQSADESIDTTASASSKLDASIDTSPKAEADVQDTQENFQTGTQSKSTI